MIWCNTKDQPVPWDFEGRDLFRCRRGLVTNCTRSRVANLEPPSEYQQMSGCLASHWRMDGPRQRDQLISTPSDCREVSQVRQSKVLTINNSVHLKSEDFRCKSKYPEAFNVEQRTLILTHVNEMKGQLFCI